MCLVGILVRPWLLIEWHIRTKRSAVCVDNPPVLLPGRAFDRLSPSHIAHHPPTRAHHNTGIAARGAVLRPLRPLAALVASAKELVGPVSHSPVARPLRALLPWRSRAVDGLAVN